MSAHPLLQAALTALRAAPPRGLAPALAATARLWSTRAWWSRRSSGTIYGSAPVKRVADR